MKTKGKQLMKEFILNGLIKCKEYYFSRDFDEGYMFYNEAGENFVVCFNTNQKCCEDFQFEHNLKFKYDEELIVSENGIAISIETVDEDFEDGNIYSFHINAFDKNGNITNTYKITICNDHNGYYWHAVALAKNGELVWEDAV